MGSEDQLDVYPDAVMRAGHRTADTAGPWQSWSTRIRMSAEQSDKAARSTHISSGFDTFAERVVPAAVRVSQQVADLGVDTSSAGAVVANGDVEATAALGESSDAVAGQSSLLRRPVNSQSAVT